MRADVMFAWSITATLVSLYNILEDEYDDGEHRVVNVICLVIGGVVAVLSFISCANKYW